MNVFLYRPDGYYPGYVYESFDDALRQLLDDEGRQTIAELKLECDENDVSFEYDNNYLSIDDGPSIESIEFIKREDVS